MAGKAISGLPFLCISILALLSPCSCYPLENGGDTKGMFVFGSSLVDNGNNNFLPNSLAKANYLPYGIDFPYGPSGRFTNGKNVIDLLCEKLGLPFVPAFADPSTRGSKIIHGVNYASGASGILDDTGSLAGEVISLNQQIKNFEEVTLPELEGEVGKRSGELLKNYLFVVGTGGNDYSLNYFLNPSNANVSLELFTANLTNSLSGQLEKLYKLGGRKFVLMSVNPIGCYPVAKPNRPTHNGCIQALNRAAHLFNAHLKSLVVSVKPLMPASDFVFVNSYKIIRDLIRNPVSKGFKDASNACCEVASISEGGNGSLCKKDGRACEDRNGHVFFDGLHPTEAVNVLIATKAFDSNLKTEAYPINIKQLAMH
ncbi:zinc finger protein, putative [Ricinus communis]|uniref:Zinc finger protein, putative n=1 Tax=Ricinus communis TaxID=3988 RepID=B9T4Z2_RICCO|nr:zinc finger protein, putative [Ricinus communis]|eukprot:XP_002533311.3 GDSL esterase/lipase At1g29670 [Ricinus communis]